MERVVATSTVSDAFSVWLTLPLQSQLASVMLIAGIISFTLIALVLFVKAIKPVEVTATSKGVKVSFFSKLLKSKKKKEETAKKGASRLSLTTHKFFKLLRNVQTEGFLQLDNHYPPLPKEIINLTFLKDCKFKVFQEGMTKFVEEVEGLKSDDEKEERVQHIPSVISDLISKYAEIAESIRIELDEGRVIYGVPSTYIAKFNKWHSDHVTMCLRAINSVLGDKLYEDWFAELRACLDFLYIAFELTLQDANKTLNDLNGDLDEEIAEILRYQSSKKG